MKIGLITDAHITHKYAILPEIYHDILINSFANCDIIVDCGDLTDKSNLTAPQLDSLSKVFENINKPIYLVAGNHDSLSGTTVASIFESKKNITVIREPAVIDNMLFVPYTDDIKNLFKQMNSIVKEPFKYAFSHLNITSNIYASISFNDTKKLHKYAEIWFNGHIHNDERNETAFGKVYNIGACSSLTFGDNHIPCYSFYDTEKDYLETKCINGSLLHRTFNISNGLSEFNLCNSEIEYATRIYNMRCKFNLPNNSDSVNLRKQIREKLNQNSHVINVVFDYIKNDNIKQEVKIKNEITSKSKKSLVEQLIQHFEQDCKIILNEDIKKELLL